MKKILLIGPPGCGKGTQAKYLIDYNIYSISTGEAIRKSKNKEIKQYLKKDYIEGKLLPDDLIFKIINEEISLLPKNAKGYVLDGAVRTLSQAKYVKKHNLLDEVIYYKIKDKTSINRILNRNEGRPDDNFDSIKKRLDEYKTKTKPVLNYLRKNFRFYEISAENSATKINELTKKVLNLK